MIYTLTEEPHQGVRKCMKLTLSCEDQSSVQYYREATTRQNAMEAGLKDLARKLGITVEELSSEG